MSVDRAPQTLGTAQPGSSVPPLPRLPQHAPFQLIDRIIAADLTAGYLVAQRLLTANDALWPAEQLQHPTAVVPTEFPNTLLIEALCQTAACINSLSQQSAQPAAAPSQTGPNRATTPVTAATTEHRGYLVSIADLRFPSVAQIGETITLEVQRQQQLGSLMAFSVRAFVRTSVRPESSGPVPSSKASPVPSPTPLVPTHHLDPAAPPNDPDLTREIVSGRLLFAVTLA